MSCGRSGIVWLLFGIYYPTYMIRIEMHQNLDDFAPEQLPGKQPVKHVPGLAQVFLRQYVFPQNNCSKMHIKLYQ